MFSEAVAGIRLTSEIRSDAVIDGPLKQHQLTGSGLVKTQVACVGSAQQGGLKSAQVEHHHPGVDELACPSSLLSVSSATS
jgi:hypothetical protein